MTFDFEERQGQLFDSIGPTDSLIFCISEDLRLSGKGMAGMFRQRFGHLHYQLANQKHGVGQVVQLSTQQHRHVFYLITRSKVYNKTSIQDLEACLIQLRKRTEQLGLWRLAIPDEFGIEGGLTDKHVKELLFKTFHGWQGKMIMYHHE